MKWIPIVLRWTARVAAVAVTLMYGALMVGEVVNPHSGPPADWIEWAGLATLSLAVLFEFLAALTGRARREVVLAMASILSFSICMGLVQPSRSEYFLLLAAPAALFVADWWVREMYGLRG